MAEGVEDGGGGGRRRAPAGHFGDGGGSGEMGLVMGGNWRYEYFFLGRFRVRLARSSGGENEKTIAVSRARGGKLQPPFAVLACFVRKSCVKTARQTKLRCVWKNGTENKGKKRGAKRTLNLRDRKLVFFVFLTKKY